MVKNILSSDSSDSEEGGAQLPNGDFKVNEEYAKRYDFNKKREERQRCGSLFSESLQHTDVA